MTGFDIVTTGGGSLVWLPDLAGWAQVIAHALAPGGKVVVWESHPVAGCGQGTEPKYEFCWPLGDVVTSLARTGLRIEQLEEFPTADEDEWRYGDLLDQVRAWPGWYLLVASKHGGQL